MSLPLKVTPFLVLGRGTLMPLPPTLLAQRPTSGGFGHCSTDAHIASTLAVHTSPWTPPHAHPHPHSHPQKTSHTVHRLCPTQGPR